MLGISVKIKEIYHHSYNDKTVKSELSFPEFVFKLLYNSKNRKFHIMSVSVRAVTIVVDRGIYNYYPVITFGGK